MSSRKYAGFEWQMEQAIRLTIALLFAIVGTVLVVITFGASLKRKQNEEEDLLEPVKKQSDLAFAFSRLPRGTKYFLGADAILVPLSAYLMFASHPRYFDTDVAIVRVAVSIGALLSVVLTLIFIFWSDWRHGAQKPLIVDEPFRYETLFRDGETAFYDTHREEDFTTYTIRVPKGMDWNAERSTRLVEQLIHSFAPLIFRIYADERGIVWQVVDILARDTEPIESAIRITYPEADVHIGIPQEALVPPVEPLYRLTLLYRAVNDFVFPFRYTSDVKDYNPLTAVVSAMNGLQTGERVIYSILVAGAARKAHERGERLITRSTITPFDYFSGQGLQRIATLKALNLDRIEKYVPQDQKVGEEKLKHPLYQSLFMLQVDSRDQDRILPVAQNVDSQLYGFARPPYNGLRWYTGTPDGSQERVPPDPETLIAKVKSGLPIRGSAIWRVIELSERPKERDTRKATKLILGGREIGLLWHLPDQAFTASRINWLSSRTVPPPPTVIYQSETDSVRLGHGTSGGKLFPIYLPIKDRENHIRIVGKTGTGKSSLMYDLIMQDIRKGYGVAVIDPHGSLVESILGTEMPSEVTERIVALDLSDTTTPPPLNPLRGGVGYVRAGQIIQSIERIYPATRQYPRLSYYLRVALLTLNADPFATIKDVVRLFTDPDYRNGLVQQLADAELYSAWEEFDRMKEGEKRTITEPIRTRMSPFYSNPALTPIMCHPDTLDFRQMMREQKIILVSLKMDEERVPQTERDLIGALLISRLQMSGMYNPVARPYFVYIDEVQRFVTSSLDNMFAEARKFGISLTVAHQFLEQLPDTTQSAIIGNAGASIVFACSPKDAQVFQPFTRPYFETDDLVNLDQFTAVVKMQCDGVSQPAFTLLTPLPQLNYQEDVDKFPAFQRRVELDPELMKTQAFSGRFVRELDAKEVRALSRQNYTPKTLDDVSMWLRQRYGRTVKLDDQTQFFDSDEHGEGTGAISAD